MNLGFETRPSCSDNLLHELLQNTTAKHKTKIEQREATGVLKKILDEEDERIRKTLIEYFNTCSGDYYGELKKSDILAWLEKQKPIEWSEEDNELLNAAIGLITDSYHPNDVIPAISKHSIRKIVKWLKSIRNRITWEPSIEQMKILEKVCNTVALTKNGNEVLESLYNDLKKLTE